MASISLPPFLKKLQEISQTCDRSIADWSEDGKKFVVKSPRFEREVVRKFFKGTQGTFVRQLHFYGFKKSDHVGGEWSFEHPKFVRDFPANIYDIRRKTRQDKEGAASKSEVRVLREEVFELRRDMETIQGFMQDVKSQLATLLAANAAMANGAGAHGVPGGDRTMLAGGSTGAEGGGDRARKSDGPASHTLLQVLQQQAAASQPLPLQRNAHAQAPPPPPQHQQHQHQHQGSHSVRRTRSSGPPSPPTASTGKRAAQYASGRGASKRSREEQQSTSSSLSSSSQSGDFEPNLLPFEDGAHPGLDENDVTAGKGNNFDDDDDEDFFDPVKKVREVGPIFDASGLDDFTDLFVGFDDTDGFDTSAGEDSSVQQQQQQQQFGSKDAARGYSQDSLLSSSSSSSSSSSTASYRYPSYDSRDVSGASTPSMVASTAGKGAGAGAAKKGAREQDAGAPPKTVMVTNPRDPAFREACRKFELRILIRKSETRLVHLPNEVFAGFLSKFVQQAMLLHKRNMLTGDIDPELEIFVHASLPSESPLKDTLIYATPYVRTVLVNVLTEISAGDWQTSVDDALGPYEETPKVPFPQRRFMSFNFGNMRKEIDGESWLMFLSFILKAAVNDDPRAPKPDVSESTPFMESFACYFSPDVNRVMTTAQIKFSEYKRKHCSSKTCEGAHIHDSSSSFSRTTSAR